MSNSIISASAALYSESQIPASESLGNQGVQEPKTDLGDKHSFEQINEVTWKLTDGVGVNAWDGYRGGYRTTRAIAGLMGLGNGKWIARYKNRWSKPLRLNKAKTYLMEMVRGIRPGHIPADPIRELHLETLKAMGEKTDSPAPINLMGGDRCKWTSQREIERGLLADILATECPMLVDVAPRPDLPPTLKGDDYPLEYHPDGYPVLPDCLRRRQA